MLQRWMFALLGILPEERTVKERAYVDQSVKLSNMDSSPRQDESVIFLSPTASASSILEQGNCC